MKFEELNEKLSKKLLEYYNRPKRRLRRVFIIGTMLLLLTTVVLVVIGEWLIVKIGWLTEAQLQNSWLITVLISFAACFVVGAGLSGLASRFILKPMNELIDGMAKLSAGAYDTRLDFNKAEAMKPLSDSFNSLATELQKTEILRSDFVNDFSHEFKTPISSISGLISLLKRGKTSKEKQKEYLDIIEEETHRLSSMTTNILNLTRIESQGILTGQTTFNLSEQLRTCLLLLEKKWSQRGLRLRLEIDECKIYANEDLLKQVWLNLLDNAVKFSDKKGELSVEVKESEAQLVVAVGNTGAEIKEEDRERIFQKFYQADGARKKEGNGIGLSIVKHIVELHGGAVSVSCRDGQTVFSVTLPKR